MAKAIALCVPDMGSILVPELSRVILEHRDISKH